MRRAHLIVPAALAVIALSASAQEADSTPPPDVAAFQSPTIVPLTRIAVAMTGIGAAGWGASLWARRRRRNRPGVSTEIQVMATRSLGPRHRLALVHVADRDLLLGIGGDSIRTLADLSEPAEFASSLPDLEERQPAGRGSGAGAGEDRGSAPTQEHTLLDTIGSFRGLDD